MLIIIIIIVIQISDFFFFQIWTKIRFLLHKRIEQKPVSIVVAHKLYAFGFILHSRHKKLLR